MWRYMIVIYCCVMCVLGVMAGRLFLLTAGPRACCIACVGCIELRIGGHVVRSASYGGCP